MVRTYLRGQQVGGGLGGCSEGKGWIRRGGAATGGDAGCYEDVHLDCASTEDLQKLISKNREPPFDRGALVLKPVGHRSYTFEFRHFQVSLDPEVVEHFIWLCVALILAANGLDEPGQPSFEEMCEAFSRIQGWKDLLTTIGLQNKIGFWTEFLSTYPVAGSSRSEQDKPSSFFAPLDW